MTTFTRDGATITSDIVIDGFTHPYSNLALYTSDELAGYGITRTDPPAPTPPAITKDTVKAALALRRYAAEISGTAVNDVPIDTDRASQAMVAGAYAYLQAKPAGSSIQFKTPAGFVPMDLEWIKTIAIAVGDHVQACFEHERNLSEMIDAETDPTTVDLNAGWPGAGP